MPRRRPHRDAGDANAHCRAASAGGRAHDDHPSGHDDQHHDDDDEHPRDDDEHARADDEHARADDVAPTLPTPVAPPPEDGSSEATWEVGTIEIPALGLWAPMYEGIRLATLNRGPGHWPGTAMPGDPGNVVLAGHRTSHNAEFRHLDRLVAGDEVVMHTLAGRFVYHVSSTEIVRPNALWIVDQTPTRTATLFACHPPGSVRERIVVHLELAAA